LLPGAFLISVAQLVIEATDMKAHGVMISDQATARSFRPRLKS
jgi:hypothetical protein